MAENEARIRLSATGASQVIAAFSRIEGGVAGVVSRLSALTSALTAGIGGAVMQRAISNADAMGKNAQKLGTTASELSKLAYAAKLSDIELDKLKTGSKELFEWMSKNGLQGRQLTDVLIEQSGVISAMADPVSRAAAAQERFGKSGLDMLPFLLQGPEQIRSLMEEADRLGVVSDREAQAAEAWNDELTKLGVATESLSRTVASTLLPSLTQVVGKVTDVVAALNRFVLTYPAAEHGFKALATAVGTFGTAAALTQVGGMLGLASAAGKLSTAVLTLGSAFAGWQFGKVLGELELFGITINNRVTATILAAQYAWERFRNAFGAENAGIVQELEAEIARLVHKQAELVKRSNPAAAAGPTATGRLSREELDKQRGDIDLSIESTRAQQAAAQSQIEAKGFITAEDHELLQSYNERILELIENRAKLLHQADVPAKDLVPMVNRDVQDQVQAQKAIRDSEKAINKERIAGTQSMFNNMAAASTLFGKKGFAAYRAFAIASATIDTAQAAIAAYKATVGIPYVGPVLAPIAAAAAVAAGAAQISTILSTQPAGFAQGGLVQGPGTSTSDSVPARLSVGEFVVPADAVSAIGLDAMQMIQAGDLPLAGVPVASAPQAEPTKVNVSFVDRRNAARDWLNSQAGRKYILEVVGQNLHEFRA